MKSEILLNLATSSIYDELFKMQSLDLEAMKDENKYLSELGATFVTLYLNKSLRGCMGSLIANRTLMNDIIHNAKAAAFYDFRFQPVSKADFKDLEIEVSLLSPAKEIIYSSIEELKEKIKPQIHGVILEQDQNKATFLPQVWDELATFEDFFSHLSKKAGLAHDCLRYFPKISVYEVTKFKK